jgi:hypothetical protein
MRRRFVIRRVILLLACVFYMEKELSDVYIPGVRCHKDIRRGNRARLVFFTSMRGENSRAIGVQYVHMIYGEGLQVAASSMKTFTMIHTYI